MDPRNASVMLPSSGSLGNNYPGADRQYEHGQYYNPSGQVGSGNFGSA